MPHSVFKRAGGSASLKLAMPYSSTECDSKPTDDGLVEYHPRESLYPRLTVSSIEIRHFFGRRNTGDGAASSGKKRGLFDAQNDQNKRKKSNASDKHLKEIQEYKSKLAHALAEAKEANERCTLLRAEYKMLHDEKEKQAHKFKHTAHIPLFLPHLKKEVERLENSLKRHRGEAMAGEALVHVEELGSKIDEHNIFFALTEDAKNMLKRKVEAEMQADEVAQELRCTIGHETFKTALTGPDGFLYEAVELCRYIEHNGWEVEMCGSDNQHLRVKQWKSPNTREVFGEALFTLSHTTHNILRSLRNKISKRLLDEFVAEMTESVHEPSKSMKEVGSLFGCIYMSTSPRYPPRSPSPSYT